MKRRRGLTLGEVMMSLALLSLVLGTAFLVLQWALVGSRLQHAKTTAAFLAQRQMETLLAEEIPLSGTGVFAAPYQQYQWVARVEEMPQEPFLTVEIQVSGLKGATFSLATQRRKSRRSLLYRSANNLIQGAEDVRDEQLVLSEFRSSDFSLSPDGQTVAYSELENGRPQIFIRSLRGGPASRLFSHPQGAREPRYSPDGKFLAFTSLDNGYSQVMVYDLTRQTWTNRSPEGRHDGSPAWMPDSAGLVICRDGQSLVWLRDGSEVTLEEDEEGWNATPDVACTGKTVVFMSSRDGNPEIYTLEVDSRKLTRLTDHPGYDSHPHFSGDGKRILFARRDENQASRIFSMNPDGTHLTPLTQDKEGEEPCWLP